MKVYFIGAGPGAADLITLRGLERLKACPVLLYAGSLVPKALLDHAPEDCQIIDTASLTLDEIFEYITKAQQQDMDVARLHSGDPSLYGATAEQRRRLDALGISHETVPGVTAFSAASAEIGLEFTLPGISQSLIVTRTSVRASAMPEYESLENFAKTRATLAIHLSINNLAKIITTLRPFYGEDCPVIIACRVGWEDEEFLFGTLGDIRAKVKKAGITRTALILVGRVFNAPGFAESHLYSKDHSHVLRPASKE